MELCVFLCSSNSKLLLIIPASFVGDENELERNLRLEKVVDSKLLRLSMETEE